MKPITADEETIRCLPRCELPGPLEAGAHQRAHVLCAEDLTDAKARQKRV